MRKILLSALFLFIFVSAPPLLAQEITVDDYGTSQRNPILVGGENLHQGPSYQRAYLDKLTGPNGEKIFYKRNGSCCGFDTENGILGGGMLDMYEVTYNGLEEPVIFYFNMYDPDTGEVKVPKGFKLIQD